MLADLNLSDSKALDVVYTKCMKPLQFDSFSMKKAGQYVHHYAANLKNTHPPKKILRRAQNQGRYMCLCVCVCACTDGCLLHVLV